MRVSSINEQFDVDLMYVGNLSKENDGVKYLLFVIDIFSRYLWVKPLKDKTAKTVLAAIKDIFKIQKCEKLRADKGSEFNNRWLKSSWRINAFIFLLLKTHQKTRSFFFYSKYT